jgi:hypothetical protein
MAEPQVIPMPRKPPHRGELMKTIRQLAKAGAVSFSEHAFADRSDVRDIDLPDAIEILRLGEMKGDITPGENPGEWKCKVVAKSDKSSRWVGVPVVVVKNQHLLITTVEWEDTK